MTVTAVDDIGWTRQLLLLSDGVSVFVAVSSDDGRCHFDPSLDPYGLGSTFMDEDYQLHSFGDFEMHLTKLYLGDTSERFWTISVFLGETDLNADGTPSGLRMVFALRNFTLPLDWRHECDPVGSVYLQDAFLRYGETDIDLGGFRLGLRKVRGMD